VKVKERSKELFQHYCQLRGYRCSPIKTSDQQGVRTPDFEVIANETRVIAETKDVTANEDDIRLWRKERAERIVVHSREPGKRARYLINAARGQLRTSAQAGVPSVVILCDNIIVDGIRVERAFPFTPLTMTDIDVALYGLWQANVRIHPGARRESLGDTRSPRRWLHNRQIISAVVVLNESPDNIGLFTISYHNYWASVPLPRNVFDGEDDFHFTKTTNPDIRPNDWVRI